MLLLGYLRKEEAAGVEVGQAAMWLAPEMGRGSEELARPLRLSLLKPLASVDHISRTTADLGLCWPPPVESSSTCPVLEAV